MPREIAHAFILDLLLDSRLAAEVRVKAMFGAHAIYVGDKIVLITRHRPTKTEDNGLWVILQPDARVEVRKLFKALRPISSFKSKKEGGPTWLCLPEDAQNFERDATRIVALVVARDPRFGKIPKGATVRRRK